MLLRHHLKSSLALAYDVLASVIALGLAYWLRYLDMPEQLPLPSMFQHAIWLTVICAVLYPLLGLYRGIWAYASVRDLWNIIRATFVVMLTLTLVSFFVTRLTDFPRSLPIITFMLAVAAMGGARLAYRLARDGRLNFKWQQAGAGRTPVLLLGAGDETELFIRWQRQHPNSPYQVLGVLAENNKRTGRAIHGTPILGEWQELPKVLRRLRGSPLQPTRLLLTRPAHLVGAPQLEAINQLATQHGLTVGLVPQLAELRDNLGGSSMPQERPLALSDLLARPEVKMPLGVIEQLIAGKRVLITGAGGTIGGELARQIWQLKPTSLVLLEASEFALYQIHTELTDQHASDQLKPVLANVRDLARLQQIFADEQPEVIFHAAAIKHVPLAEANPSEAILTNILGSQNVFDCAALNRAAVCVLISTDKAVLPSSVMGGSKRVAEQLAQHYDQQNNLGGQTRFVAVRFGNVLGSTGSVVPRFQAQIARGGPVTVTHSEMTRFFMSVPEAVSLVLQASAHGLQQTTRGQLLVLDMGQPVRIVDLARQLIRLAGKEPERDIAIEFIGLRPGEKMHEELASPHERMQRATHGPFFEVAPSAKPLAAQQVAELIERAGKSSQPTSLKAELLALCEQN